MKPLVSIIFITYNQEGYVAEAIDSFLMQKTNFDFEILIHDDASTDGTINILKSYQNKYPKMINLTLEKENQHSKNNLTFMKDLYSNCKGKYIAVCEGDDFWTDPQKLQKQVNMLEANPEYSICFHPVRVFFENKESKDTIYPKAGFGVTDFTIDNLLRENFIQTNSVMYRKQKYTNLPTNILPFDWYMHLYHAKFGKIGFINEVMASYRRHNEGLWWESYNDKNAFWVNNATRHFNFYSEVLKSFSKPNEQKIIYEGISNSFSALLKTAKSGNKDLVKEIMYKFNDIAIAIFEHQQEKIATKDKQIEDLYHAVSLKENHISNLEKFHDELKQIKSSRSWKILQNSKKFRNKN